MGKGTDMLDYYMPSNVFAKWMRGAKTNGGQLIRIVPFIVLDIAYMIVLTPVWLVFKMWEFVDWCRKETRD